MNKTITFNDNCHLNMIFVPIAHGTMFECYKCEITIKNYSSGNSYYLIKNRIYGEETFHKMLKLKAFW